MTKSSHPLFLATLAALIAASVATTTVLAGSEPAAESSGTRSRDRSAAKSSDSVAGAGQTLNFPNRPIGSLFTANAETVESPLQFGPAQGKVIGPKDRLLLYKPSDAVIADPTLLKQVPPNIVGLDLYNLNVSDEFVRKLLMFHDLRYLRLSETEISDGVISNISQFPKLNTLLLNHCDIKGNDLDKLARSHELVSLVLVSTACSPETLAKLKAIQSLKRLNLSRTRMNDDCMKSLGKLVNLTHLNISKTRLSDSGMSYVQGLKGLRQLAISGNGITDAGLKNVGALPNLEQLECLGNGPYTKVGITALKSCTALRVLDISRNELNDDALKALVAACPRLTNLILSETKTATDKGFENLGRLSAIKYLVLSNTSAGDGTARALAKARTLTSLDLQHTAVTNKGVALLASLPQLSAVVFSDNPKITDEAAKAISASSSVRSLSFDSTGITDASLPMLMKMHNLTGLVVLETKISTKGFAELKRALPGCAIAY